MTAAEEFQTWHTEIEAELEAANHALVVTAEALSAAQLARNKAVAEQRRGALLLDGLASDRDDAARLFGQRPSGLPTALASRLDPLKRAAHLAEGALTMAKQNVANAQWRIDDTKDALERLERAMTPAGHAPEAVTQ
jgi:hypothetical protein